MTHLARAPTAAALVLILGLVGLGAALAITSRAAADGAVHLRAGVHPGPEAPVSVPLTFIDGHLYVGVDIEGRSATMLLDTGAPTSVSAGLTAELGATSLGVVATRSATGDAGVVPVVRIPRVRLGTATFEDVGAVVAPVELAGRVDPAEGIVGANLMAGAVWQIDYAERELRIAQDVGALGGVERAIAFDFAAASPSSPSPVITLGAGTASLRLLVDTGSNGPLLAHPADAGAGGRPVVDPGLVGHVVNPSDAIAPGHAIAGNAFLDDFIVTIDWPRRRLYLARTWGAVRRCACPSPARSGIFTGRQTGGEVSWERSIDRGAAAANVPASGSLPS